MPEQLLLSIEKLVYGGDGLAHTDGNTVFVPYVLPGEQVRAAEKSRKKKLIWADLLEVTSAANTREKARCPHFQICGGCHYQHISAVEQLRLKKDILRETLSRLGTIRWEKEIHEHSAEPYGYRNRAQWALREGQPRAFGYFLPESSTIVPVDECPVLSPLLAKTLLGLQELARSGRLPVSVTSGASTIGISGRGQSLRAILNNPLARASTSDAPQRSWSPKCLFNSKWLVANKPLFSAYDRLLSSGL